MYTGCGDGVARCFDTKSGSLKRQFKGHTGAVNCLKVRASNLFFYFLFQCFCHFQLLCDFEKIVDNRLYTGSFDGTLKIWNIELSLEKGGGGHRGSNGLRQSASSFTTSETKMSIENEKSLSSSRSSSNFTNNSRANYSRSDSGSGFDDQQHYYQRAKRIDVKEIV